MITKLTSNEEYLFTEDKIGRAKGPAKKTSKMKIQWLNFKSGRLARE